MGKEEKGKRMSSVAGLLQQLTPTSAMKASIEKSQVAALTFVLDDSGKCDLLSDEEIKDAVKPPADLKDKEKKKHPGAFRSSVSSPASKKSETPSLQNLTDSQIKSQAAASSARRTSTRRISGIVPADGADFEVAVPKKPNLARAPGGHDSRTQTPGAVGVAPGGFLPDDYDNLNEASDRGAEQPPSNAEQLSAEDIEANIVDDEEDLKRIKDALQLDSQNAVQVVDIEAEDRLKRRRQRKKARLYLAVAFVLAAAIIAAVVVSVRKNNEVEPTGAPTMAPTMAPTSRVSEIQAVVEDAFGPVPSDPSSPQMMAISWLADEDETITFPLELDEHDEYGFFYDRYSCVVLAFSTGYETWIENSGWLDTSISVCDGWYGLACNDDDRVSVLDLSLQNMTGPIPSELGIMESLDFVFMFSNKLTGTLPAELGNLGDADFFYLNDNLLTGTLSSDLSGLLDADELFLQNNMFTGSIPESFGSLVDLVNLRLDGNQLSGMIPSGFSRLKRLQQLYLNNNRLQKAIPTQLGGIISLKRLLLNDNELTGQVPSELGGFLGLEVLMLQDNALTGNMPDEICANRDESLVDSLEVLQADCATGEEVNCTCCTKCY
jgi:hypothetical protein